MAINLLKTTQPLSCYRLVRFVNDNLPYVLPERRICRTTIWMPRRLRDLARRLSSSSGAQTAVSGQLSELCALGFFSCSHGKFATRPFAGRGAPAEITGRENAGFPQQKRRTTRSVDHELGFRFPEEALDYKFRIVRFFMSSNLGKVQYHMPIEFGKVYSIELAAHEREEYDARQKSEGAISVLARFIAQ